MAGREQAESASRHADRSGDSQHVGGYRGPRESPAQWGQQLSKTRSQHLQHVRLILLAVDKSALPTGLAGGRLLTAPATSSARGLWRGAVGGKGGAQEVPT